MATVELPAGVAGYMAGMEGLIFAVPFIILSVVLGLLLFFAFWKTPFMVFLKCFLTGKRIEAMKRKDGTLELTPAKYSGGLIRTKYGVQILDEGSAMPEKKSGIPVFFGIDTIGITLHPKMMKAINALKKNFGLTDVREINKALDLWRGCEKCGHEGVAVPKFKKEITKLGDIKQESQVFTHLECAECGNKTLKRTFPKIDIPIYETINLEDYDRFFKYNYTPSRNDVIIEREVKAQMAKQRQFPVKWIAIAMAFAIILIGGMIGLNIYTSQNILGDPVQMLNFCETLLTKQAQNIIG